MSRSYSDPSYGSKKVFSFHRVSMGTRSAAAKVTEAGEMTVMNPITITKWNITCNATGNGGTSQWTLRKGTVALGTLNFVTNPTAGTTVSATLTVGTGNDVVTGDVISLYSATSVASPTPFVTTRIEYVEHFVDSDN